MKSTALTKTSKIHPRHALGSSSEALFEVGARSFMRLLTAAALLCLLVAAASMGLDQSSGALPSLSGFIWEDRDDTAEGADDGHGQSVAGFIWEDRDDSTDDTEGYAGYLWEDRDEPAGGGQADSALEYAGYLWEDRDDSTGVVRVTTA